MLCDKTNALTRQASRDFVQNKLVRTFVQPLSFCRVVKHDLDRFRLLDVHSAVVAILNALGAEGKSVANHWAQVDLTGREELQCQAVCVGVPGTN